METKFFPVGYSGSIPGIYDKHLGQLLLEPFAGNLAQHALDNKTNHVLELACGTGRVTKYLIDMLTVPAKIIATDINPDMLAFAKNKLLKAASVVWQLADAHALPFANSNFDLVISQFGAMFFQNRTGAYKEVLRVLKPGRPFVFNVWDTLENNPAVQMAQLLLEEYFPFDPPDFYHLPFGYCNENELSSDLEVSGFTSIAIKTVQKKGYSPTAEAAATGLLEGTPVHTQILERNTLALPVLKRELARRLKQVFGTLHLEPLLQAKVVRAVKPAVRQ